jgi:hypothetical protein
MILCEWNWNYHRSQFVLHLHKYFLVHSQCHQSGLLYTSNGVAYTIKLYRFMIMLYKYFVSEFKTRIYLIEFDYF